MNLKDVTYDAFISYRHCELDQFVAENLHRQLEAFKLPKSLIASGKTNGRTKIERVFRDQEELPLVSNLADPITTALEHSDYLIVICSPRLPESKWCLREIETFIELHGREHILAVLVEGEPADSFPDILRFAERTVTDANGNSHKEKVEVEPLAADVRGENKREILKKIKAELLRLAAPMFGCNYDDLKMRHREARQKRILRISLGISTVCLIFAIISTTMALTIHRQSDTIKEQYTRALETQAVSSAAISQTLLSEEDRMAAMSVARTALPDSMTFTEDKPYTPAAEYALSDSLGVYNNGRSNFAIKTLEQTSPIYNMLISPERDTITTIDIQNQITVFDISTAKTLASYTSPDEYSTSIDKGGIRYLNNSQLAYVASGGYCIYDILSQEETFFPTEESFSYIRCSEDGRYIALSGYSSLEIYDTSGKQLFAYQWPDGYTSSDAMSFSSDKKRLAFTATNIIDDAPAGIIGLVDTQNMKLLYTDEVECSQFKQASFLNDMILFGGVSTYHLSDNALDIQVKTFVYSYPLNEGSENWTYQNEGESLQFFTGTPEWEQNIIAYAGYHGVEFINADNGSSISAIDAEGVISMAPLKSPGYVCALTKEGEKLLIGHDSLLGAFPSEEYDTSNGPFVDYEFGSDFEAGYRKNATAVTIYQKITSKEAENCAAFDDSINENIYSSKQQAIILRDSGGIIYLYHTNEETIEQITNMGSELTTLFFTGTDDEQFVILSKDNLTLYDTQSGKQLRELILSDIFPETAISQNDLIATSAQLNKAAFYDDDRIVICSLVDGSTTSIPLPDNQQTSAKTIGFDADFTRYAVASTTDNTLTLYDAQSGKQLQQCEINASLVEDVLLSKDADCILVTYLDGSVTVYQLNDLSVMRTYTNFTSRVNRFDCLNVSQNETDSPVPVYALYGDYDCYLLDHNLEPVAHLYRYVGFDEQTQKFFLSCKENLLKIPYYTYDMLIKEADEQLADYKLSEYRKNQLGID